MGGGGGFGIYWFILIHIKDRVIDNATLKPKMGRVVGSFLETNIGGKTAHAIEWSGVNH